MSQSKKERGQKRKEYDEQTEYKSGLTAAPSDKRKLVRRNTPILPQRIYPESFLSPSSTRTGAIVSPSSPFSTAMVPIQRSALDSLPPRPLFTWSNILQPKPRQKENSGKLKQQKETVAPIKTDPCDSSGDDDSSNSSQDSSTDGSEVTDMTNVKEAVNYIIPVTQLDNEMIFERYFKTFRFYIETCVKVRDLIAFFEPFTTEQQQVLRQKHRSDPRAAVRKALDYIEGMKNKPNKYTCFIQALQDADYPKVVAILKGRLLPMGDKHRSKIKQSLKHIYQMLSTEEVMVYLHSKNVVNNADVEEIKGVARTEGRGAAAIDLLYMLPNRSRNWFKSFIEALVECKQIVLAHNIDSELALKIERRKTLLPPDEGQSDSDVMSTISVSSDGSDTHVNFPGISDITMDYQSTHMAAESQNEVNMKEKYSQDPNIKKLSDSIRSVIAKCETQIRLCASLQVLPETTQHIQNVTTQINLMNRQLRKLNRKTEELMN